MTKFRTAVYTFKGKYGNLPGDMPDATTYWPTTCVTDPNNSLNLCNGNGDGQVDNGDECITANGSIANINYSRGVNTPPSAILPTAIYWEANFSCIAGFNVGLRLVSVNNGDADGGVMTGADAYSIDSKIDDGYPGI